MIVILKENAPKEQVKALLAEFEAQNLTIHYSKGEHSTLFGLVGDTAHIDVEKVLANDVVADVRRISEPYKAANRRMHPVDTVVEVCGRKIGAGYFSVIAGPCSVESQTQMEMVAESVKNSGAAFLRGGAFKPRTSPYSFQGLEDEGLKLLSAAKKATGLPIVTEIMSESQLDEFEDVDIIQVGARNMQNFRLLKELGHCRKPILLRSC